MSSARITRVTLGGTSAPQGIIPTNVAAAPVILPPKVDEALVHYLKQFFPVTLSRDAALRDYDRMLGAQELIQHLEGLVKEQNS